MIRTEPAFFMGIIEALILAAMNLIMVFGVELTVEQVAAINGFVGAAMVVILSLYTRSKVSPVSKL